MSYLQNLSKKKEHLIAQGGEVFYHACIRINAKKKKNLRECRRLEKLFGGIRSTRGVRQPYAIVLNR